MITTPQAPNAIHARRRRRLTKVPAPHLSVLFSLSPAKVPRPAPIINVLPGAPDLPFEITTNGAYETIELDGAWAGNEIIGIHHLAKATVGDMDPKPERLPGVPCRRRSCDAFTLRRCRRGPMTLCSGRNAAPAGT